jgi:hypothetical protein
MKKFLLFSVLAGNSFITLTAHAQSQFSGWLATFNSVKTSARTSIHSDFQYRSSDKLENMQTLLLRTGLNVHAKKNIIITGGYAYISNRRTISGISGYAPEHRIWEQLIVTHKLKKNIAVSHRFRVEQRFIAKSMVINNSFKNDGSVYANRFRYFIRNVVPLNKQSTFTKGAFVGLQNEVFVNFGNTSNVNGKIFDQNRLLLSTGYRLSSKTDIEAGYLYQYISGRNNAYTYNHIVQLACYLRL